MVVQPVSHRSLKEKSSSSSGRCSSLKNKQQQQQQQQQQKRQRILILSLHYKLSFTDKTRYSSSRVSSVFLPSAFSGGTGLGG